MIHQNEHQARVLHVVGAMNRAGIETWLMRILRNIDRDRFRMDFLVHTTEPGAYDEEIRDLGSRIFPCPHSSRPWAYARDFKRIIQEFGPYDIVHSQQYLFSGLVLRLAAQSKVPVRIAHMHPLNDIQQKSLGRNVYKKLMTSWISKYANCIIAPSLHSLKSFNSICDCSGKYNDVIYNCLNLDSFEHKVDKTLIRKEYALPTDIPVITYVARFVPHKNHIQMVRIADRINKDGIRAHFVMAGSHGECLETLTKTVSNRKDITCLIGLPDITDLLLASDLFFFPSLEEGFGVVAIEAAAAGLPVVAADLPTIREACAPSHRELMFPPDDDETASMNIRKILDDPALWEQLSADARPWASRFSIEQSVDKLTSVYEKCLAAAMDT